MKLPPCSRDHCSQSLELPGKKSDDPDAIMPEKPQADIQSTGSAEPNLQPP